MALLRDISLVAFLAVADFRHEARLSLCLVIALAAVLAPLLTLFGLRHGIVSTLREELRRSPMTLELKPLTQGRYGQRFFEELRRLSEVDFVMPTTRFLAATISLQSDSTADAEPVHAEMIPTARGDPLLRQTWNTPLPTNGLVLSQSAAEKLKVSAGDIIEGRLGRVVGDDRQRVTVPLTVHAVLPVSFYQREAAFVNLKLLLEAEDYREGFAVPAFGAAGRARAQSERLFASFRLYTRTVDEVESLRDWLAKRGIDTSTKLSEIRLIQRLDRSLVILFLVIAGLGGCGFALSLMISLWGSVERKRYELSVLRLLGLPSRSLAVFPMVQATLTAAAGCTVAGVLYAGVAPIINSLFAEGLTAGQVVCRLPPANFALACFLTLFFALISSSAAGLRATRFSPAEGLRYE